MSSQPPFDPQDLLPKRYTPRNRSSSSNSSSSTSPPSASRTTTHPHPQNPMPDRQRSPMANPPSAVAAAASSSRPRTSSRRPSFTRSPTSSIDEPKPFLPRAHNLSPQEWKHESELFIKHYLPLVKQGINIEPLVLANARAAAEAQGLKKPTRAVPPLIIPPSALPEYKHLFPSDPSAPKSPQAVAAAAVSATVVPAPAPVAQPQPSQAGPSRPSSSVADARAHPIRQPPSQSNPRLSAPPNLHRRPAQPDMQRRIPPPHQYDPNFFQRQRPQQQPIPRRLMPNHQVPGAQSRRGRAPISPQSAHMNRHLSSLHSVPQIPIHPKAILRSGNHPDFPNGSCSSPTAVVASAKAARGRMHALSASRGAAASPRGRSVSRGGRGGSGMPMPPLSSQRHPPVNSSRAASSSASSSSEKKRHSSSSSSVPGSGGRRSAPP